MSRKAKSAVVQSSSADTKEKIKSAALMLFARHGVEGVTVQQIVVAAEQRNNAALHYHFGTKVELVRQLIVDGAAVLDQRRQEMLLELERKGRPATIREVIEVLVMPVVELAEDSRWRGYVRFTSSLQASDGEALRVALNNRWNAGYVHCFSLLKKMLPLPAELIDQRLTLFAIFANATLSAREEAMDKPKSKKSRLWDPNYTTENVLDVCESMLTGRPSVRTMIFFE